MPRDNASLFLDREFGNRKNNRVFIYQLVASELAPIAPHGRLGHVRIRCNFFNLLNAQFWESKKNFLSEFFRYLHVIVIDSI